MHLPPSKTDGAVEITGETMFSKLGVKVCRMQTAVFKTCSDYNTGDRDAPGNCTQPTGAK